MMSPDSHPVLFEIWHVVFWSTPVLFLLQLVALVVLLWRVAYRWRPQALGARAIERGLLVLGVAVAPVGMLFMSAAFVGGYQAQRGHWFFHAHDGLAGLVLVPVYALGSVVLGWGIAQRDRGLRSGFHLVVLWTLIAVCVWYAFATAFLGMTRDAMMGLSATAVVPALAAVNYALLASDIRRHERLESAPVVTVVTWFSALALSLAAKVPLAMKIFDALPPERPAGYGDCFVVGAAARGHAAFVGSRFDPALQKIVNRQWRTLRAFEDRIAERRPVFHRSMRGLYNRMGPPVAARVGSPLAADIVYVLLKPIEWLARLYLAASNLCQILRYPHKVAREDDKVENTRRLEKVHGVRRSGLSATNRKTSAPCLHDPTQKTLTRFRAWRSTFPPRDRIKAVSKRLLLNPIRGVREP